MLTKCVTPQYILLLREAEAGQREQPVLSVLPGELSCKHETEENSKVTGRSYYWLPQLWTGVKTSQAWPGLLATQPKPNSVRLFSPWRVWKQDKRTILNTRTSSPWVPLEMLKLGTDLTQLLAKTGQCEKWLSLKAGFLPHAKTPKDPFLLQFAIHPPL